MKLFIDGSSPFLEVRVRIWSWERVNDGLCANAYAMYSEFFRADMSIQ
jgi:hypothetical protein